jgi:hypothetical protein
MEIIGEEELLCFKDDGTLGQIESFAVRKGNGCPVSSYIDLATKVATLQLENPITQCFLEGKDTIIAQPTKQLKKIIRPSSQVFFEKPQNKMNWSGVSRFSIAQKNCY